MRKFKSGGVTVSKRPNGYTDMKRWNRTLTCYSGIVAYRFMFLDSVSTHLRLEYEFQNKSRVLLEKNADFNVIEFSENKLFNVKSTLLRNNVKNETLVNGYLATDFYANIKQKIKGTELVSNFAEANKHIFWTVVETEKIHLLYDRKPKLYSEWDQILGPLTLSKYDRIQFQFICLTGLFNKNTKRLIKLLLVDEECPIGYNGKLPNCHEINRFLDTFFSNHSN